MAGALQRTARGYRCGSTHHCAKYTEANVEDVRNLQWFGLGWRRIARQLGLKAHWVKAVCTGRVRYTHAVGATRTRSHERAPWFLLPRMSDG